LGRKVFAVLVSPLGGSTRRGRVDLFLIILNFRIYFLIIHLQPGGHLLPAYRRQAKEDKVNPIYDG
jgi:hypothetical protein